QLARVLHRDRIVRHRLDDLLADDLSRSGRPSQGDAGATRLHPGGTWRQERCATRAMGVLVRLPHHLGNDDRLLLPELRDLFLYYVVPNLSDAGQGLFPGATGHLGIAARPVLDTVWM